MAKVITVPEEFFIGNVAEVAGKVLSALQGETEMVLDLSLVNRIDTAAIQLLLSARKEADHLGVTLSFTESELVQDAGLALGARL